MGITALPAYLDVAELWTEVIEEGLSRRISSSAFRGSKYASSDVILQIEAIPGGDPIYH